MKEDILEQAVADWFISKPSTFIKYNVKYKPDSTCKDFHPKYDSNCSDIDVLAIHLNKESCERVSAVSCKSWQLGFNPKLTLDTLKKNQNIIWSGRPIWKAFRELSNRKWGKAFAEKVHQETLSKDYTYYLIVTKLAANKGVDIESAREDFESCPLFMSNLQYDETSQIKIKLMTFRELFLEQYYSKNKNKLNTLESTELGRLIQIFRAADIKIENYD